jgi:hypothetical protein
MLIQLRKGDRTMCKRSVSNQLLSVLVITVIFLTGSLSIGAAQEEAMALTQLRQSKSWYAERVRNWKLEARGL